MAMIFEVILSNHVILTIITIKNYIVIYENENPIAVTNKIILVYDYAMPYALSR